jgi:hypothetical protein
MERRFAELDHRTAPTRHAPPTKELEDAISTWIANWNHDPKPVVWPKTADEILDTSPDSAHETRTQDISRRWVRPPRRDGVHLWFIGPA